MRKGRRSDTHKECNNKTSIWHELACLGIDSSPSRERSAQAPRLVSISKNPRSIWEDQHQRAFMTSFTAFAANILLSDAGISTPMSLIA